MGIFSLLFSLFFLTSCQFFVGTPSDQRPAEANLRKVDAEQRSQNISHLRYLLAFDITQGSQFQGTTQIFFDLKSRTDLTLDFTGGQVQQVYVNDKPVSHLYNDFYLTLPKNALKMGENHVVVRYTHAYNSNGTGLHRMKDPVDGRIYMFSHFEPYFANQVFPCFDQPDLKATFQTEVLAPENYQVVTSVRELEVEPVNNYKRWVFPESARFPTYAYSLHAGEYVVWEDSVETKKQTIPLRLMARQSIANFVDPAEWFDTTKKGFQYFEGYFSYQYPFKKFDQVITPDFNHSGMENVAAVVYSEDRFVSKGEKTRQMKRQLASVILHEMAHMWFGDLVTMKWWDDLWLNESFATFSSYMALAEATEFKEAWQVFNQRGKQKAYDLDQSLNTHPVATPVESVEDAFANFDAISYSKGASLLRQLSFLIGEKSFKKGLKSYFTQFEYSNTTLVDFMGEMTKASGKDLKQWTERWLQTAMLNDVEVFFTCEKGRVETFEIFQKGTQRHPMLRTHKTTIALFRRVGEHYKVHRTRSVEYSGGRTSLKEFVGELCPHIVYPNYQDHDYATVTLDKVSLKNVESSLVSVESDFVRNMLWADLWRMVLSKKMDMERFLEIVEFNGLSETEPYIIKPVFANVEQVLKRYYPDQGQPWEQKRLIWVKFFEQALRSKVIETSDRPELQRLWFESFVAIGESQDILAEISKVLKGKSGGLNLSFQVNQDMRWSILGGLTSNNFINYADLIASEAKRDTSKRGELEAVYVQSQVPDIKEKKRMFASVVEQRQTASLGWLRSVMEGLFPKRQESLHRQFVDLFYSTLSKLAQSSDLYYLRSFTDSLTPVFCDRRSSSQLKNFIDAEKDLPFAVVKSLKSALFENNRCYEMRRVLKETEFQEENGIN